MAKLGRGGASYKAQYKKYKSNGMYESNKIDRLRRTLVKQPNNLQAQVALDKVLKQGAVYTRNKNTGGNKHSGLLNAFGFEKNKSTMRTPFSHIWHTTKSFRNWFLPSAEKNTAVISSKSIFDQLSELGYKTHARKYKKSPR